MSDNTAQASAMAMIKEVYDDSCAEINGREYIFTKTTHKKRRKIYAFYTRITSMVEKGDHSFLDWAEWEVLEEVIGNIVTFEDVQLTKSKDHWDKYPSDYLQFIMIALPVISYPFFPESGGS